MRRRSARHRAGRAYFQDHLPKDDACRRTSSSPPKGSRSSSRRSSTSPSTSRREVAERIKEAREFGDISENSEYDDAKNEQAMLEARIAQLEDKLRSAQVIDATELDTNVVRVGSLVAGKDEKGKAFEYTIVGSTEADPANKRLSNESPVGKALIGRKKGDTVTVPAPKGERKLKITKIERRVAREPEARTLVAGPARPAAQARGAARRRDRPVPARLPGRPADRRRQGAVRGPRPTGRRPTCAPRDRRPPGRAPRPGQGRVPRPRRPLGPDAAARARRRARRGGDGAAARRSTSAT